MAKTTAFSPKNIPHPTWIRIDAFLSLKAPKTSETYRGVIFEWCRFLGISPHTKESGAALLKATDLHAMAFRAWLEKQPGEHPRSERRESTSRELILSRRSSRSKKDGLESTLSNATIAKKFAVLRRIYRMLIGADLGILQNPFDSDRAPAPPKNAGRKRPTEMIEFNLVRRIIDGADLNSDKGIRDRALLCILFGGALRRSEAAALTLGDVRKSKSGTVFLYLRSTKAKKDAEQALPPWAAQAIAKLVQLRVKEGASAGDPLFISYTGRAGKSPTLDPISSSGIYKLFKIYCEKAGAGKFVSPHSARATAITRLLDSGIPHREVQEFSRHASIQMVELYDKRRIGVDDNAAKNLKF